MNYGNDSKWSRFTRMVGHGRLIACETCGGHEDARGTGMVDTEPDYSAFGAAVAEILRGRCDDTAACCFASILLSAKAHGVSLEKRP